MSELRQRRPQLEVPGLTDTARGQDCTLRVPEICPRIPEDPTVVWCHSNEERHGKGKGLKSHDPFGAFGCRACHDWYDRTRDPRRGEIMDRARDETLYQLFAQRKLKVVR